MNRFEWVLTLKDWESIWLDQRLDWAQMTLTGWNKNTDEDTQNKEILAAGYGDQNQRKSLN